MGFFFCASVLTCVCVRTRLHVCVVWCVAISHSTCADLSVHTYGVSFVCFMQQFKKNRIKGKTIDTALQKKKMKFSTPKFGLLICGLHMSLGLPPKVKEQVKLVI